MGPLKYDHNNIQLQWLHYAAVFFLWNIDDVRNMHLVITVQELSLS